MTHSPQKIAFLFPGQGAQYSGMGKDFYEQFQCARHVFEEADDLLKMSMTSLIFNGQEAELTLTQNSQVAIFITSVAIQRVFHELYGIIPTFCAGLSLGEYTALTASGWLPFQHTLPLVRKRGEFMGLCCSLHKGTMAVIMGLNNEIVENLVADLALPEELFVANYNCPGQVVISGTNQAVEKGIEAALAHGAKRALPLQVSGAFHSGLMKEAKEKLAPLIEAAPLVQGNASLVMNVPGDCVKDISNVRAYLIDQVTHSVRWSQGIEAMERRGVDRYIEFGPGKTLSGMNKRIGVKAPTYTIEKVQDLEPFGRSL